MWGHYTPRLNNTPSGVSICSQSFFKPLIAIIVYLSLSVFLVVSITCPSRATVHLSTVSIWTDSINSSGRWPDGVCFIAGLSTPSFMLVGLDSTLHLAEESPMCHSLHGQPHCNIRARLEWDAPDRMSTDAVLCLRRGNRLFSLL